MESRYKYDNDFISYSMHIESEQNRLLYEVRKRRDSTNAQINSTKETNDGPTPISVSIQTNDTKNDTDSESQEINDDRKIGHLIVNSPPNPNGNILKSCETESMNTSHDNISYSDQNESFIENDETKNSSNFDVESIANKTCKNDNDDIKLIENIDKKYLSQKFGRAAYANAKRNECDISIDDIQNNDKNEVLGVKSDEDDEKKVSIFDVDHSEKLGRNKSDIINIPHDEISIIPK